MNQNLSAIAADEQTQDQSSDGSSSAQDTQQSQDAQEIQGGEGGDKVETDLVLDSIAESVPVQRAGEAIDSVAGGWAPWAQMLALVIVFVVLCVGIRTAIVAILQRVLKHREELERWLPLVEKSKRATMTLAIVLGLTLALLGASARSLIPGAESAFWDESATFGIILSLTWLVISLISGSASAYLTRYEMERTDNSRAQRIHTQVKVLSRAVMTIVGIVGVALGLMAFESVERIGTSMLASAGVMGIIVGFAAKQVLENLLAGVQIALTQPLRLGDVVEIDGHYGTVEEISMAFVSIKLWNERRLIVPLSDIISDSFQNLTRTSSNTLGPVILRLDFDAKLDRIREKLDEILDGHELHDGRTAKVQVINSNDKTMEVRILASASTAPDAWNLHCDIREKMLAFLIAEHPEAIPVEREQTLGPDREPLGEKPKKDAAPTTDRGSDEDDPTPENDESGTDGSDEERS